MRFLIILICVFVILGLSVRGSNAENKVTNFVTSDNQVNTYIDSECVDIKVNNKFFMRCI